MGSSATTTRQFPLSRQLSVYLGHLGRSALVLLANLFEVVDALLVRGNDIQQLVAVDIGDLELRSDAAVMIELMADPVGPAVFALQFEPEKDSWLIAARIMAAVSPPAFAGDEVHEPVTVDVGQADAVCLREALVDLVSLPVVSGKLFVPPDAEGVGTAAEHIVVAVAVEVVHVHLRGAVLTSLFTKGGFVELPRGIG